MRHLLSFLWLTAVALSAAHAAAVDGIEIHSESVGSGPTIVFVHGWTCDVSSWRDQVPAFADDYRVITLDLPGHGQSESPAADGFSLQLFADAVEAVRAEAGAGQIVLVGHSMGAPVIRTYALSYPDRVAGLVAVDGQLGPVGIGGGRGGRGGAGGAGALPQFQVTREMREGMIRGMFVESTPADLQTHILQMMLGAPAATASGAMAAMFAGGSQPQDVIAAPALAVMAGSAQLPNAEALRDSMPNFSSVQLPGTGHFLMMEQPDEFNALLREFLTGIDF